MKCIDCGHEASHLDREWDNVYSYCPQCGQCAGTIFIGERGSTYEVKAHGRMGNRSLREDPQVGVFCDHCGYRATTLHRVDV